MSEPVYDRIGLGYAKHRRAEPRWAQAVVDALGVAGSVVNVGAGAGSYEPLDRPVVAVEPSATMLAQRRTGGRCVRAVAEALPFGDRTFDAAMAMLTTQHWTDASAGLSELARVSARQVVLTWEPAVLADFWLLRDYLPEAVEHDATLATLATVIEALPGAVVQALPVPADCADGVLGAYWRRPEAYLDPSVRSAISGLALLDPARVAAGVARLAADLGDGTWARRHGHLRDAGELDLGYRLVIADSVRP